jgi:3-oxoacyl-[acyl-carrier protein] reductase
MFSLKNKNALVTGGSRGIGRGIVLALAKAGANVAVNYHSKKEEADKVVEEIKAIGVNGFAIKADVSKREEVVTMFEEIKSNFGSLNILVNNAGVVSMGSIDTLTDDDWDKVINTNLKGHFICIQEGLKLMPKGGKIVSISSIASGGVGVGFGNIAHYASSKGGVVGMVEDLAIELGPRGININAIGPGVIESDMTSGMLSDEKTKQGMLARIPKGRVGKPEDIGNAVVFLSSDEADYITGVTLYVDGGWLSE